MRSLFLSPWYPFRWWIHFLQSEDGRNKSARGKGNKLIHFSDVSAFSLDEISCSNVGIRTRTLGHGVKK